jgi:hypothetical protein
MPVCPLDTLAEYVDSIAWAIHIQVYFLSCLNAKIENNIFCC